MALTAVSEARAVFNVDRRHHVSACVKVKEDELRKGLEPLERSVHRRGR